MDLQQAVDEFLLYLKVEQNYSTETIKSYELNLARFHQFLKQHHRSCELQDLNRSIVRRFIQDQMMNANMKPRTIQRRISGLMSFCKYVLKERLIDTDFMVDIKPPKSDFMLPVYMNLSELRQLFLSLEQAQRRLARRNEAMFKLMATTGMRRQELVTLTWGQLDFYNQTIRIFGKGKKERLLPLHPSVLPVLEKYKSALRDHLTHPTEPVFLNKNGHPINPRGLHVVFKEVLRNAGLPPARFSLHHLRHTFATLLLQQPTVQKLDADGHTHVISEKVDLKTLQELLGHESLASTEVYTHIDFASKKKAIDSFDL
ncbi:tyrosine-type recombinase/integrase [Bacillus sp. N3536]|nr:tyrosine-type recombinase/integrase [Bacillus sp. N3536]